MAQKLILRTTDGNRNANSDLKHEVELAIPGSFRFDNQGNPVSVPRLTLQENWDLFPVVTSVSAASSKTFLLVGTDSANILVTRASRGGIRLTTDAVSSDAMAVNGISDTSANITLSASNQVQTVTQISVGGDITELSASFGLFTTPSTTSPGITSGNTDCAYFIFDPSGDIVAAMGIESSVYEANWVLVTMANSGTAVAVDSEVKVIASIDYELRVAIGTDLKPVFYINGTEVGAGETALSAVSVKVAAGVMTAAEEARYIECRYIEVSRRIG